MRSKICQRCGEAPVCSSRAKYCEVCRISSRKEKYEHRRELYRLRTQGCTKQAEKLERLWQFNELLSKNRDRGRIRETNSYRNRPISRKETAREWRRKNPEKILAIVNARRARKLNATSLRRVSGEQKRIEAVHKKARRLTIETGTNYVVDHIVPLAPCRVCGACGLHESDNLQIMTAKENSSKGNRCQNCWRPLMEPLDDIGTEIQFLLADRW